MKLNLNEVAENPDKAYRLMHLYCISKFMYDADEC